MSEKRGNLEVVFQPDSNSFVPDVAPVWRKRFRVLRPGAALLAGAKTALQRRRGMLRMSHHFATLAVKPA